MPSALITGAGSGIGLATAQRFLKEGWKVIAIGRRLQPLEELKNTAPSGQVLPLACDLRDVKSIERASQTLLSAAGFGHELRALINNAGVYERLSFDQTSDAVWQLMFETNLMGPVRLTRALLPRLTENEGVIVNVSSTLGLRPVANTSAYSALKAALVNWTQSLALEVAPQRLRVNCVCPGIIDTPIHAFHTQDGAAKAALGPLQPLGRLGRSEDVAHAIWSLCAPGSEWMTGSVLTVDGGISLT